MKNAQANKRVALLTMEPRFLDAIFDYRVKVSRSTWEILLILDGYKGIDLDKIFALDIDGVIGPMWDVETVERLTERGISAVSIMDFPTSLPTPIVTDDNVAIGRLAADHLLKKPERSLYFFNLFKNTGTQRRYVGFCDRLKEAGKECLLIQAEHVPGKITIIDTLANPQSIIPYLESIDKPASIFAANDFIGLLVISACRACGLKVPDDVCVIGVDNKTKYCRVVQPELSSIDLNTEQVAFKAAETLDRMMQGEIVTQGTLRISPLRVIQRASTDFLPGLHPHVVTALQFIRANIEHNLVVGDVLRQVPISRRILETRFRGALDKSIYEVIQDTRLESALRLLKETDWTIEWVIKESGYPNKSSLQEAIKKATGLTAAKYRETLSK